MKKKLLSIAVLITSLTSLNTKAFVKAVAEGAVSTTKEATKTVTAPINPNTYKKKEKKEKKSQTEQRQTSKQ